MSVNQSHESNQQQNNFHIDQDEQGNPAIFIPVWQNEESHPNQSYIQQKQQQIRMYKSKIHHLEKHIEEYDRNFQNLYAALNQATHSEKVIKRELIQTRTLLSQFKIQKESLGMHNQMMTDKVKQMNLTQVEDRSLIECLEQENKLLKKRNQDLLDQLVILEHQKQHVTINKPINQPRSLKPQQIQKYQASLTILQNQLAQQKRQKSRLQKALKDHQMDAGEKQEEIRQMGKELQELRQKLAVGKKEVQRIEGENARLRGMLEELEGRMKEVEEKGQQVVGERQKHEGVVKKLKDKIKELQQELTEQRSEHQSTKQAISSLQQKLKLQKDKSTSAQKQKRTLQQQFTRAKQQLASVVQQKDERISRLTTQVSQFQSTIEQFNKKLQRLQEDSSRQGSQVVQAEVMIEIGEKSKELQKMLENVQNDLNKEKKKSKGLEGRVSELQLQINSLKSDKQLLLEELDQLKNNQKLTSQPQQRRQNPSSDNGQLMHLQGIIKEKQKQLRTAKLTITQLQSQLQHSTQQVQQKQSNINQLQRQLISSKQKLNSLQQKCKRLEKLSSQLSSSSKKQLQQPVHKECESCGELQNQLQEMQSLNEELSQKLQQSEKQNKSKEQQIKKLIKQVEKHKKQSDKCKKQGDKSAKSLKQAQQQILKLNQQVELIKEELQRHKQQLNVAIEQKQQLEEQLSELKTKIKQLSQSITAANKQLGVMKSKEKQRQAKHKEQIKRRDQQIKAKNMQSNKQQEEIFKLLGQLAELENQIDELRENLEQANQSIRQKEQSAIGGSASIKSKQQAELQTQTKNKQKLAKENNSLKDVINSLKKELSQTSNKLSQVEAQLNQKLVQITSLRQSLLNSQTTNIIPHSTITADHTSCKSTQSRLTQQVKSFQTQLSLANKQLAETTKLLEQLYAKQSDLQKEFIEAQSSQTKNHKPIPQKADHSTCNTEIQQLKGRIEELGADIQQRKKELALVRTKSKEYEEEKESLKTQIRQLQEQKTQLKQQIQKNKQNLNRQPQNVIFNSASKGLSESDYQMTYQNQLQKLRRLLISSKSTKPEPQGYLPPMNIQQKQQPTYNSRQFSPYKKPIWTSNKSQDQQMIHSYYEQEIRKILGQLEMVKLENAKLREFVLRIQGEVSMVDVRKQQCHNCRILQDSIFEYQQKITLLQVQINQLRQQVYQLRCLNEQYAQHRSLRQTEIHHHNSIEISDLIRELDVYRSEIRRFEKLLRQQERIYQTKLVSKEEEIKLLHIRIQSIRLGKQTDVLFIRERDQVRTAKQVQSHTQSLKNSPSLQKGNHVERVRKGRDLNRNYLVGMRDQIQKRSP